MKIRLLFVLSILVYYRACHYLGTELRTAPITETVLPLKKLANELRAFMPGLHSHLGSRVLVQIFGEMWTGWSTHRCRHSKSRARIIDNEARHSRHSHFLWLGTDLSTCLWELRDENRLRVWKTRRTSRLVSCCPDENVVNQALKWILVHPCRSILLFFVFLEANPFQFIFQVPKAQALIAYCPLVPSYIYSSGVLNIH